MQRFFNFHRSIQKEIVSMVTKSSISENAIYIHIDLHFKVYFRTQKGKKFLVSLLDDAIAKI